MEIFIEEDIRYKKHCTQDNDIRVPFKAGALGARIVLSVAISCPSYFPESHWWPEISSVSKVILVWGKARNHRVSNLGGREAELLG